ncbi:MAG: Grx4 family monothiol glutaredoxin [Myxococcales bacterium]|nr:Grx4 family monothiol glutaredoxin [Myxococcales bacterium]
MDQSQDSTPDVTQERIGELVRSEKVVLFMKGTRQQPQCGFSATVVGILDSLLPDYRTVNVLADPTLREGIKVFSSWPTIPQLYVDGEFLGGCDIVREMYQSGELEQSLGITPTEVKPPTITVTPRALEVFRLASRDAGPGEAIRVEVSPAYQTGLGIEAARDGDVRVVLDDITLVFDRISAQRSEGMSIDYVDEEGRAGFKIDNPNAPPTVVQVSVEELAAKLEAGAPLELFDVRTPREREIAKIEAARPLDDDAEAHIRGLAPDTPLYFHCHHGGRSQRAAEYFLSQGFTRVHNVVGGIDAWSLRVDPKVPRY